MFWVYLSIYIYYIAVQVLGAGIIDGRSPWACEPTKAVHLVREIASVSGNLEDRCQDRNWIELYNALEYSSI